MQVVVAKLRRIGEMGVTGVLLLVAFSAGVRAEDLKGRWYFGGNLGFLSTTDDIRSNAAIQITDPGDDGIPFTGDLNEVQGCPTSISQQPGFYCDPRPDDLLVRENTIEESFKLDLTAGFGLTDWLSLQFDAAYFKGTVGPVDAFLREVVPDLNEGVVPPGVPRFNSFIDREQSIPVDGGELTEIPVSLSGVFRFRKDSPLNPYVGAGLGIIFTEFDRSGGIDDLNLRLSRLHIRGVQDEVGNQILAEADPATGEFIFDRFVTIDVDDAFEWHLMGGMEYFVNDRFSVVFDARYMFADTSVSIDLGGIDQVNLLINSESLYRANGTQRLFQENAGTANPFCRNLIAAGVDPNIIVRNLPATKSGCPELDSPAFNSARLVCNPSSDAGPIDIDGLDSNGQPARQGATGADDFCFKMNLSASDRGLATPQGLFIVQGGKIDLTGFSVAVGVRFHF